MKRLLLLLVIALTACEEIKNIDPVEKFVQGELVYVVTYTSTKNKFHIMECKYFGSDGDILILFNKKEKEVRAFSDFVFRKEIEAVEFTRKNQ